MMRPDRQQRPPVRSPESAAAMQSHHTPPEYETATVGGPVWYVEAEESLRDAGRKLEALGVTDPDAARLAGVAFRLASRLRSDRTGVHP